MHIDKIYGIGSLVLGFVIFWFVVTPLFVPIFGLVAALFCINMGLKLLRLPSLIFMFNNFVWWRHRWY